MLLPQPISVHYGAGHFAFEDDEAVSGPLELARTVRQLLSPGTGLDLASHPHGRIRVGLDGSLPREGYRLEVDGEGVTIAAADQAGMGWAVQTVRQLLPPSTLLPGSRLRPITLPHVLIEDWPRFPWRGMHLDTGRYFAPLSDLYRFVDLLAMHKFNVFHLHLTEDQGWRFESKRYPLLQEVGSWRAETRRPYQESGDGTPHGGFYRQDQLRALVGYAASLGVTIVPELDFPGHVRALLAAYPELGNDPDAHPETATTFGIFDEVLSLDDRAMAVVFDLYEELLDVFPGAYVHVGGDECPTAEWSARPEAAELAAERGLTDPRQLQRWFTEQVRSWLAARGRTAVGWDEIVEDGAVPGAVAMAWRGAAHGVRAAEHGMNVVMAPAQSTYLDYYPSSRDDEPYRIGGLLETATVYRFEPLEGVPDEYADRILGVQGQLWTEYMPTSRDVDYSAFPRACALAEVGWSDPTSRAWSEFEPRLAVHLERLDVLGVNYRPEAGPHPWQRGGSGHFVRIAHQQDPTPE